MNAVVVNFPPRLPRDDAQALWDAYTRARDNFVARWPDVNVEDMRVVVRAFDAVTAALTREGT